MPLLLERFTSFTRRCAEQKQFERQRQKSQSEGDDYSSVEGLYTTPLLSDLSTSESPLEFELTKWLGTRIEDLLQRKQSPVVVLDIGGGAGLSWRKLAETFEEEVRAGELAFVVSNLVAEPDDYLGGRTEVLHEDSVYKRGKPLVHFINSTFSELEKQAIILPNGQPMPLQNNVDIVHEHYSLTSWSLVPETDILHAARLLSSTGIYLVPSRDTVIMKGKKMIDFMKREAGIQQAHRVLQTKHGLTKVTTVEEGPLKTGQLTYTIFKAPATPPIRVL